MMCDSDSLILIHVVSRHGAKCTDIVSTYPNDPHKLHDFYPHGNGMLTNKGKNTMYAIGKAYRKRYDTFLGDLYFPEILETWTTDYPRTKASAQLLLAGLFPPNGILKWNDELNWQPIHTNYSPMATDELLVVWSKDYREARMKVANGDIGQKVLQKYRNIIPYIEKHTGLEIQSVLSLWLLRDCLHTEEDCGLQLPNWTKAVYPEMLNEAGYDYLRLNTCTKELRRLTSGVLLKKILTDTQNKINEKSKYKLHLYVGHDITIANMLSTMGLFYDHVPKYGASVAFEVHGIKGRYGIKILYKEDETAEFKPLTFPTGETIWWMEDFENFIDDLWSDVMP